jgi:phosphate transport system permease protein
MAKSKISKEAKKRFKRRIRPKTASATRFYIMQDRVFEYFALTCTFIGIIVLGFLLYNIFSTGWERLSLEFIMNPISGRPERSGILAAWTGTLWLMGLTAIFALPVGIATAIYLEEYERRSRFASLIEINISNLAGVPSIIYGLLGLEIFVRVMGMGESILAGSLTLALLVLPIIVVSTRESLRTVPQTIREASYALGASKWQTIWRQVLPASVAGIFTGVILALSRAIGESAPLIVVGALAYVKHPPSWVNDEFTALPIQIFNWVSMPKEGFKINAAAGIIVLLFITFLMNGIAVYLRHRWQKKIKW